MSALPTLAAGPPTGENAYCGKGNVAQFGAKDGPAELPKTCYYTALDGTPSPGEQIRVAAKSDLAAAIDGAKCGDTLLLPAGASFEVETLPSKKCDDQNYITVRTDTPDSKLPPEGTRISPAWGGVASLPGRPPFAQPSGGPARLLATLVVRRPSGAVVGDHVRFIGIEWTTPPGGNIYLIATAEHADHVIFDRNWVHPADGSEVGHGVGITDGSHMIAVINSYVNGLNCIALAGKCTDATAVGGGYGDEPVSTVKIYNNFLESSGENILFGGAPSAINPTDIEIRRNHLFRPMLWREGEPGYTPTASGHPYVVKNNFELKSAIRVLFEANLLENSWGGFSQSGYSILLTPKNQHAKGDIYVCPLCQVTDVTIRYVHISHAAGGIQMATVVDTRHGDPALAGTRWSIHDVVIDDLSKKYRGGGGVFEILNEWPKNPLNSVTINHVTGFPDPQAGMMVVASQEGTPPMYGLVFTNNIVGTGRYPVWDAIGGPGSNCAHADVPVTSIANCFATYTFSNNALVETSPSFPPSRWPSNNMFPQTANDVRFVNYNGGNGGNYELRPNSPYKNKGTDGKDLGADIVGVNAALAGVE
ncbi:MAG: hypothetical protein ABSA54_06625 [Terriglobales bacterium]